MVDEHQATEFELLSKEFELPESGGLIIRVKARRKGSEIPIKQVRLKIVGDEFWKTLSAVVGKNLISTFKLTMHPVSLNSDMLNVEELMSSSPEISTTISIGVSGKYKVSRRAILKRLRKISDQGNPPVNFEFEYGESKFMFKHLGVLFIIPTTASEIGGSTLSEFIASQPSDKEPDSHTETAEPEHKPQEKPGEPEEPKAETTAESAEKEESSSSSFKLGALDLGKFGKNVEKKFEEFGMSVQSKLDPITQPIELISKNVEEQLDKFGKNVEQLSKFLTKRLDDFNQKLQAELSAERIEFYRKNLYSISPEQLMEEIRRNDEIMFIELGNHPSIYNFDPILYGSAWIPHAKFENENHWIRSKKGAPLQPIFTPDLPKGHFDVKLKEKPPTSMTQIRKSNSSVRNSKDKSPKENHPQVPLEDVNKPPQPEPPQKEPVFEANSLAEIEAMRRRYREESERRNKRNLERAKKKKERDEKEEVQLDAKKEKEEKKVKEHKKNEEENIKNSKREEETSSENSEQDEKSGKSEEKTKPVSKPWWEEAKEVISGRAHEWRKEHIRKRAPCIVCGNPIHGHGTNGYVCKNCNSTVHTRCASKAGECSPDDEEN